MDEAPIRLLSSFWERFRRPGWTMPESCARGRHDVFESRERAPFDSSNGRC
jgi:hypothetical protein